MKINIKRYFLPLAAVLFMVGCHEAVEPEAIEAWAGWVTLPSPGYTRAGLLIEDVQYDYYNPAKVWAKTREAIGIMNPSI